MWKTKFPIWLCRLNERLNLAGIGFVSAPLSRAGKRLVSRILASNEHLMIEIEGCRFYIRSSPASIQEYLFETFEPYTTELFKRAIKPGATVLDIGAQFGYYSLLAAKLTGPDGMVFSFEPVPRNFEVLIKNIEMNNYNDIICPIQKAVGNKRELVTIFLYEHSDSHGMFRHPTAAVDKTISVECITVDEFLEGRPVDVIKIDIEGNEPFALEGMEKTISKNKNLILFTELAPIFLRKAGVEPRDYISQLKNLGFKIQIIDERRRCLKAFSEDIIVKSEQSWHANLFCTKG